MENCTVLYVAVNGNDGWSGGLSEPNESASDGPLASIQGARDRIRTLAVTAKLHWPVEVLVRGGLYTVSKPIEFTAQDHFPVTYRAFPGEVPVISAGKKVAGWQEAEVNGKSAWVADVAEVKSGNWQFRSLYVNGSSRRRPKTPKLGFLRPVGIPGMPEPIDKGKNIFVGSSSFYAKPGDIDPDWKNLQDVEVFAMHWWVDERMPIASYDQSTGLVSSSKQTRMVLCDDVIDGYARYWLENVFEAMTEPGEWYLDRAEGKLYYIPLPGETIDNTEVFAPVSTQLLKIQGSPLTNQLVEYITFQDISFTCTDWQPVSETFAGDAQAAVSVRGAIYLEGARCCRFLDCNISGIGHYGIEIGAGCSNIEVIGCEIADLGAGGIRIGGADSSGPAGLQTGYNVITDNHVHHGGLVFMSAVGIFLQHSFCNTVAHNHIHDLYYSVITVP